MLFIHHFHSSEFMRQPEELETVFFRLFGHFLETLKPFLFHFFLSIFDDFEHFCIFLNILKKNRLKMIIGKSYQGIPKSLMSQSPF